MIYELCDLLKYMLKFVVVQSSTRTVSRTEPRQIVFMSWFNLCRGTVRESFNGLKTPFKQHAASR